MPTLNATAAKNRYPITAKMTNGIHHDRLWSRMSLNVLEGALKTLVTRCNCVRAGAWGGAAAGCKAGSLMVSPLGILSGVMLCTSPARVDRVLRRPVAISSNAESVHRNLQRTARAKCVCPRLYRLRLVDE